MDNFVMTDTKDRSAESVEKDQTAHTCSLIFVYTLRKMICMLENDRLSCINYIQEEKNVSA